MKSLLPKKMILSLVVSFSLFALTSYAHNGPLVTVPVSAASLFNAPTIGYPDGIKLDIVGPENPVYIKRDNDALWVEVVGILSGSQLQNISIHLDLDHSASARLGASDFMLRVNKENKPSFYNGSSGGWTPVPIAGWSTNVSFTPGEFPRWNAEFKIESSFLLGWNHVVGISVSNEDEGNPIAPAYWPLGAKEFRPDTWADLSLSGFSFQSPRSGCATAFGFPNISISASPDLGVSKPDVTVLGGAKVSLSGFAQLISFNFSCLGQMISLPFTWSMSYQDRGSTPVDATADLVNSNTLTPAFKAKTGPGEYIVSLVTPNGSAMLRIEVINSDGGWYSIGPDFGRLNCLAFDPGHPDIMYAGSALGGVFKSTNRGGRWFPVSDFKNLPTLATGSIAVDIDGTIYIGTGDTYPSSGIQGAANGIFKSVDGGNTWAQTGTTTTGGCISFTGLANKIVIDPNNSSFIYAATGNGLLFSSDKGNCWRPLPTIGAATDVVIDPLQSSTIYVGSQAQGIFKVTNASSASPIVTNILTAPSLGYGYVRLAMSSSPFSQLYTAVSDNVGTKTWILRLTSIGWAIANNSQCGRQCNRNIAMAVDPLNPKHLYFAEVKPHHSTNGGDSFNGLRDNGSAHDDFNQLLFAPDDPTHIYAATDGGAYILNTNGNTDWLPINNYLTIGQIGVLSSGPTPHSATAGFWDNGTQRRDIGTRIWRTLHWGDGFNASIDAAGDDIIFLNSNAGINGNIERWPDGKGFDAAAGYVSNPFRDGELAAIGVASKNDNFRLYFSENANSGSVNWTCADPNPTGSNIQTIDFAGNGTYFASFQNGTVSKFTVPPNPSIISSCALGTVAQNVTQVYNSGTNQIIGIAVDPLNLNAVYAVAASSTGPARVVLITQNAAGTWAAQNIAGTEGIAGAIPGVNLTNAISGDKSRPGVVYVGSQNGLWTGTRDAASNWTWALDKTVPDTWITGIVPHRNKSGYTNTIQLSTYGRGAWERKNLTKLCLACMSGRPFCFTCPLMRWPPPKGPSPMPMNGAASFEIPYNYQGKEGPTVTFEVIPVKNGKPVRFFTSQKQTVTAGTGKAIVSLMYNAKESPALLQTDGYLFKMTNSKNRLMDTFYLAERKTWVHPSKRLLHVESVITDPSPAIINIPLVVQGEGIKSDSSGISDFPVSPEKRVVINAPKFVKSETGTLFFNGWSVNGEDTGLANPITIAINNDTYVTAHFTTVTPKKPVKPTKNNIIPIGKSIPLEK